MFEAFFLWRPAGQEMISDDDFLAIAEAAVLKDLTRLKESCRSFGEASQSVQDRLKTEEFPQCVLDLFAQNGPPSIANDKKRRRFWALRNCEFMYGKDGINCFEQILLSRFHLWSSGHLCVPRIWEQKGLMPEHSSPVLSEMIYRL